MPKGKEKRGLKEEVSVIRRGLEKSLANLSQESDFFLERNLVGVAADFVSTMVKAPAMTPKEGRGRSYLNKE